MTDCETRILSGWGRSSYARVTACLPICVDEVPEAFNCALHTGSVIAHAGGRSYGDIALNSNGGALLMRRLNRIISFDPETRELVCEPGVTFHKLLREYLPQGYCVPVSPGTGFATVGGAIANDVHGKNHDVAGSFGRHVVWIDLLLPTGEQRRISRQRYADLFRATIGGAGLTGIILAACIRMSRREVNAVRVRERRIASLEDFFTAFEQARADGVGYSVGWIDAMARGAQLGRGILELAEPAAESLDEPAPRRLRVPVDMPDFVLNPVSIGVFNTLYFHRIPREGREKTVLLERFLYPLDTLLEWNRIYGRRGFYQFQCVLPNEAGISGIRRLLERIVRSRAASFLAVLKTLGGEGEGYLSFPQRGYTLALDFPCKAGTGELLGSLESITRDHGGRVYLAKDACLSPEGFAAMYPKLDLFRAVLHDIDTESRMHSDLARRLRIR